MVFRVPKETKKAILDNDFSKVGQMAEENCMNMHLVMMTSSPPLVYWHSNTLEVIELVRQMRRKGQECYFTIDAGPNVHCLCKQEDIDQVQRQLERLKGVIKTIPVKPGGDSYVTKKHLF